MNMPTRNWPCRMQCSCVAGQSLGHTFLDTGPGESHSATAGGSTVSACAGGRMHRALDTRVSWRPALGSREGGRIQGASKAGLRRMRLVQCCLASVTDSLQAAASPKAAAPRSHSSEARLISLSRYSAPHLRQSSKQHTAPPMEPLGFFQQADAGR